MMVRYLLFVFLFISIWIFFRTKSYKRKKQFHKGKEVVMSLFFLYLLGVFYVTFEPFVFYFPDEKPLEAFLVPFEQISEQFGRNSKIAWYYLIANIIMLVPLGIFLPTFFNVKYPLGSVILAGFVFSLTIETLQLLFTFRSFDVDDLIFNTIGALVGYFIYRIVSIIFMKKAKKSDTALG